MAHLSFEPYSIYLPILDKAHDHLNNVEIKRMPVLWTSSGYMWEEGCAYLAFRAKEVIEGSLSISTLHSAAWHLLSFLKFCENADIEPMVFGPVRHEKPTYLFRAFLLATSQTSEQKKGLQKSTAAARINSICQFFSWAIDHGFLSETATPFRRKNRRVPFQGKFGPLVMLRVESTDLSIRISKKERQGVEEGLLPVSREVRDEILRYAYSGTNTEFALMLDIGFRTGLRLQTICSMTEQTLELAHRCDSGIGHYLLVGPLHGVATKFSVNYRAWIPDDLFERLLEYSKSPRRLLRQQSAEPESKNVLFLSRWGQRYIDRSGRRSAMVSQELCRLRKRMPAGFLSGFYFHCTRATFGTSIVAAGLRARIPVDKILNRVRQLLGHKYTETSLRYIAFAEEMEANQAIDKELSEIYES